MEHAFYCSYTLTFVVKVLFREQSTISEYKFRTREYLISDKPPYTSLLTLWPERKKYYKGYHYEL